MKLVLRIYQTDGYTYGYDIFYPFEYESKDKFLFDLFEKHKDWDREYSVELFKDGPYISKEDFEQIESNIFTLEEWFEYDKISFEDTTLNRLK